MMFVQIKKTVAMTTVFFGQTSLPSLFAITRRDAVLDRENRRFDARR